MKNSFKNALYNAFGFVFPVVLSLLTVPYIVHKLTLEVYGIYVLAISLMGLMSFLDLGFGQGIVKFVSQYEAKRDYDKINKIIGVSLSIYLTMGLLGCVLIFSLSGFLARDVFKVAEGHVQTTSLAFNIVAFGFLVNFINGVFLNIPRALQRYDVSVKIQNAVWFCSIISMVILLYLGRGLISILLAHIFFRLVGVVIFYKASKVILPTLKVKLKFSKDIFREIFGFSIFTAINGITGNIVFRVDKMVIGAFLGTEAVALYNIPFMIVQMVNGFINSVSQFLFPVVSYIHSLGDKERLKQVYAKSIRYVVVLALISATILILLGETFLSLWMGKEFAEKSAFIIPIISVVFFFISISVVGFWFYNGLGRAKINMISSFVAASCYLILSLILIPKLGLMGAAVALAFVLIPFPIYFYILNRLIGGDIKWLLGTVVKAMLILALVFGVKYVISIPVEIEWFIFVGLLAITYSVLMSYLLKIIYLEDLLELKSKLRFRGVKV